jgi:hypothetical protein
MAWRSLALTPYMMAQEKGTRDPDGDSHVLTTHKDAINL